MKFISKIIPEFTHFDKISKYVNKGENTDYLIIERKLFGEE